MPANALPKMVSLHSILCNSQPRIAGCICSIRCTLGVARIFTGHASCEEIRAIAITMKSIPIAALIATAFTLTNCKDTQKAGDASFARTTFLSLARGDTAVQSKIDWPTLVSLGQNVGAAYVNIPSETEKQEFRNAFVTQFSSSFRENGGSVDNFTNWRVTFHDSLRTEVAADSPGGVLKVTVSERDSVERISALDIIK